MSAGFHLGLVRRRRGCFRVSQATAILLNGPFNSKASPFAGALFRSVVNEVGSHWQGAWRHDMMGAITGTAPGSRHILQPQWGKGNPGLIDRGIEPFDPLDDEAPARSNRTRFLVLSAVIILALSYMIYAAFPGNALYFLTVSEFNSKTEVQDGRLLRVSGKLVEGTFGREGNTIQSSFRITDNDGNSPGATLQASYTGVLPDLFFNPHSELILEGSYGANQVFHADNILVKCPSKYRDLEDELDSASG